MADNVFVTNLLHVTAVTIVVVAVMVIVVVIAAVTVVVIIITVVIVISVVVVVIRIIICMFGNRASYSPNFPIYNLLESQAPFSTKSATTATRDQCISEPACQLAS